MLYSILFFSCISTWVTATIRFSLHERIFQCSVWSTHHLHLWLVKRLITIVDFDTNICFIFSFSYIHFCIKIYVLLKKKFYNKFFFEWVLYLLEARMYKLLNNNCILFFWMNSFFYLQITYFHFRNFIIITVQFLKLHLKLSYKKSFESNIV